MDFNTFKSLVIAKCAEMGIEEYELYYTTAESTSVSVFQQEINEFTSAREGGLCFRCIVNGKMGYASTEALNEATARSVVEQAADNASVLEAEEPVFLCEGGKTYQKITRKPYDLPGTDVLITKVLETQKGMYDADPMVVDGTQTQGILESSETAIYNSKGLDLHSTNTLTALVAAAVIRSGDEMENDYKIKLAELNTIDVEALTKELVAETKGKLGSDVAPTGQYSVVFAPEAMADLLAVYSSIFSSEAAQKGLSKLAGKEGEIIASEAVTLVDDPFHPMSPMQWSFDAEGCPTRAKNLIEKGQFKTLLYNLKTANMAGVETTGNASKAGYDAPVGIRPFVLCLQPGEISKEDLLKKVGNGVYIQSLQGLHAGANAVSGDFSLQSAGFMIENGQLTKYVKSFTVAGNFYDLLMNVKEVASDLKLPGMGRFGAPSVHVDGLSIAGK